MNRVIDDKTKKRIVDIIKEELDNIRIIHEDGMEYKIKDIIYLERTGMDDRIKREMVIEIEEPV